MSHATAGEPTTRAPEANRREVSAAAGDANSLVLFAAEQHVAPGMSRREVVAGMLGGPEDTFATEVWIDWNVKPKGRPPEEDYTTLLVVFATDRGTRILLVDEQATKARLARLRARAAPTTTW